MKKISIIIILLVAFAALTARVIQQDYTFDDLSITEENGFNQLKLPNTMNVGNIGEPSVPWAGASLYLGTGVEAKNVRIIKSRAEVIDRVLNLEPIQPAYPLSYTGHIDPTSPDASVYGVDKLFPYSPYRNLSTHFLAGHALGFVSFSPFDYNPVTGEVTFYHHVRVEIETGTSSKAQTALSMLKTDSMTQQRVLTLVDNTNDVFSLNREAVPEGYEYLIILDQSKIAEWQPLINYYESKAWRVEYKTVQEIQANGVGADLQDKIRNTVIDEYTNNNIHLVLLAGDTDVIPHRGFYVEMQDDSYTDADIPADMYYGCLDGNWNSDGDNFWGEPSETDLVYEVAVGRICYNSNNDIANAINKIVSYQAIPIEDEIETNLMVGEYLWDAPTYGGDYMDEMIDGSNTNGHTTVGVPSSWTIDTIYDRDLGGDGSWGSNTILNAMSQGYNFINHLGHSSTTYTMRLSNSHVTSSNITNNGSNHNFSTFYTQGCYGGAFDNRETNPGQYTQDCISEKFQALPNGIVAMLSNSRYGWGSNGSTNGPSQYYHRQFVDAMFGENINEVGWANADSKADVIPFLSSGTMYWCYYQVNLFGDPGMRAWTATPQDVQVVQNGVISGGSYLANFTISVPNADVRILSGNDIIFIGQSDDLGNVYALFDQAVYPGAYQLIVNADNHYPLYHNFNVIPSNEPYVTCTTATFHDEDNVFQLGDHVFIDVTVENIGTTATDAAGTVSLSTESSLINIVNPVVNIANLGDTQQVVIEDAFEIVLQGSFTDQTTVPVQFSSSFNGSISNYNATITLNAAHINLVDMQVSSENYFVSPGDDIEVYFTFENSGSAPAEGVMVFFINTSPYLSLTSTDIAIAQIPIDGMTTNTVPLTVHVTDDCPMDTQIDLNYLAGGNGTNSIEDVISIYVSSGVFTFEPSQHNFTNYIVTPEFQDQWHRETQRNHTAGGGYSMKFGGSGNSDYANSSHGALETVPMTVLAESQLKFWHWMAAENDTNGMAWDGGMVEMSVDNGPWVQINPVGGYPYMITDNDASPFDAYTEVYSGSFNWQEAVFDLGNTSGSCKFRFVFGSDGYVSAEGWYVDDVTIWNQAVSNDDDVQFVTQLNKLNNNYPNPFNPETTISFNLKATVSDARVEIFNVRGQKEVVLNLDRATREAGSVIWKADEMSSGVYFYRLVADGKTVDTKKAILMK